ncbi:MAG: Glyoxalase family protein, partial [uncultured Solirubrobacteraceae bacterium]
RRHRPRLPGRALPLRGRLPPPPRDEPLARRGRPARAARLARPARVRLPPAVGGRRRRGPRPPRRRGPRAAGVRRGGARARPVAQRGGARPARV